MSSKPVKPLNEDEVKFLGLAFKHLKEKPIVDFDGLSKECGMSKGGANNKFREIKKRLDELSGSLGVPDTNTQTNTLNGSTKRKAIGSTSDKKRAKSSKNSSAATSDNDNDSHFDEAKTRKKKLKATHAKSTAKANPKTPTSSQATEDEDMQNGDIEKSSEESGGEQA